MENLTHQEKLMLIRLRRTNELLTRLAYLCVIIEGLFMIDSLIRLRSLVWALFCLASAVLLVWMTKVAKRTTYIINRRLSE